MYNRTIASERVVEIPVVWSQVEKHRDKDILEVGNVLAHYFSIKHDVLDKYEKGEGVINADVVNFIPDKKYDLIISISTMEHVGYSYGEPLEPEKFSKGIANLKTLLKSGGKIIVTFPLFYNSYITDLVEKRKTPFSSEYFLKRVSVWNEWQQISYSEAIEGNAYDQHFANANILYVGIFNKK
jgi:hypothetical protein